VEEDVYEADDSWVFEGGDDASQVLSGCVEKYKYVSKDTLPVG
jgi:hypothetical protein